MLRPRLQVPVQVGLSFKIFAALVTAMLQFYPARLDPLSAAISGDRRSFGLLIGIQMITSGALHAHLASS